MKPEKQKHNHQGAFSLMELMVVIGVVVIVAGLLAPAMTGIKGGADVTNAAYAIKGALEQARTYAMANNTYTWVGFAGSVGSNVTDVTGQVSLAVVASNDGTNTVCSTTGTSPATLATDTTTFSPM